MFFDDDFAMGRWGNDGLSMMDDLLGGPMGFDAGEIVITGRVPGALYVDDFSEFQTGLEHIQPLVAAENAINVISFDLADLGEAGEPAVDDIAPGEDQSNDEDTPSAMIAQVSEKILEPQVLITLPAGEPLGVGGAGDLDLADVGRPVIDLSPVLPTVTVTLPSGEEPAPLVVGGRAYQSLAFLLLDTPYVVGDENLPPTVRPPINDLLGLGDEEDVGTVWILPSSGRGAWVLR